ncbi:MULTISPECIES: DUF1016 N-terminal domain-containing protein [unclassified Moraxella]|uniref:DUF1016 N-terminal domain-containing protein n=1 Tax=unclassified Moraxella TaxID=2685852 RepID=UPI003AF8ADFE
MDNASVCEVNQGFVTEVIALIQQAKSRVATTVNAELTLLYWHVGERIHNAILQGERADYGKQVIANLSESLTMQFGKGWSKNHLNYCVKFYQQFCDINIVHALREKLSWTHFKLLAYIEDPIKRDFYATLASQERWSTRTLDERIGSLLFERTALSKKPDEMIVAELAQLRETGIISRFCC